MFNEFIAPKSKIYLKIKADTSGTWEDNQSHFTLLDLSN